MARCRDEVPRPGAVSREVSTLLARLLVRPEPGKMVNMGKQGETLVEVRLFDSARFYRTSSSAWSQEDANQEPQVDDREWANWDDDEWAGTDVSEDEQDEQDDDEEERDARGAKPNSTIGSRIPLSPPSTARGSPAAEEPQEPESRRKLLVGATPGRAGRPHRERYSEPPPPAILSVQHGGEERGWGASYSNGPARRSGVSTPNSLGCPRLEHPEPLISPRGLPGPQAPEHKTSPVDGRPLPAQPQPRVRSRGRYLGSAGRMGLPVRSRGSDKGLENQTPAVRLSPAPASAPALDTGTLADMVEMTTLSPRADPGNEFLPAIHGTKMSQLSQKLTPLQFHRTSSESTLTRRSSGSRRRSKPVGRASDDQRQCHNIHGRADRHPHGGWGRIPRDDGMHSEQDQIRLPSLSLGLVVTNAARRACGDGDARAAHQTVHTPVGGPTQKHPSAAAGDWRPEDAHHAPKGITNKRRHHHQSRHHRHLRGYQGGEDGQPTFAVVSRRQGGPPVSVTGHGDLHAPATAASGAGSPNGPAVSVEPPPVLVTAAPQLQQNVLRQIENDNASCVRPTAGSAAAAASASRSEARKQRQQLRLARGLP